MSAKAMTVAGVMSGTSADGIDVAVVRIDGTSQSRSGDPTLAAKNAVWIGHSSLVETSNPKVKLLAHEAFPYPAELRKRVLAAMNAQSTSTAELARLNWRLGLAYAEAVGATARRHKLKLDLAGCHGQTLYHQARAERYAGRSFGCTWQAGEAQAIAAALSVPVVSNFRPGDMLAGGQGAPLVPLLDYVLFADVKRGRVLQNIGGIANFTVIPPKALPHAVLAFDTGPGNMVIDWLAQKLFDRGFDRGGAFAAQGRVIEPVLSEALRHAYFRLKPPKTAGREQFGRAYAAEFLDKCRSNGGKPADVLATATALTAESIAAGYKRFVTRKMRDCEVDFIVSGGGAKNRTLMKMLAARLEPVGCIVRGIEEFGMPSAAKEAAAFALLAWCTWHRLPGNMPSATGAKRPVILGQVTYI
jgi:anhydro-N-acetylmuramic acid kinase